MESRRLIDLSEADLYKVVKDAVGDSLPKPDDKEWLTSDEAMAYLRMPPGTFYKLTASGKLKGHKHAGGQRMYFTKAELDNWRRGK